MNVARFRSPQEFIPHAYWLMTNSERDRTKCLCKYCTESRQKKINDSVGLSRRPFQLNRAPSNPESIEIEATDGDVSRWPKNTIPEPGEDGNVNFMRPVSIEEEASKKWRTVIGKALAEKMRYSDFGTKLHDANYLLALILSSRRKQKMDTSKMAGSL